MGSRTTGQRRQRLRVVLLVAAALTMLLATAPGLVAQEAPGGFPAGTAPNVELDPAEEPTEIAPETCSHAPGEFLVGYTSEEAFQAAPTENVVETFPEILVQHLTFPEVAGDPAAEEAKRQELSARPGVAYAEYNCTAHANEAAAPALPPASCAECGRQVVDRVKNIIGGRVDNAEGKDAYEAALEAARTANDEVALASDTRSHEEGAAESDAEAGTEQRGSEESRSEEESVDTRSETEEEAASDDAEVGPAEKEASSDAEPVSQKNVLPGGIHEMAGSPSVLALGAGVLLLAVGLLVTRKVLWK